MRLSEVITIYLSVGASFGVYFHFSEQTHGGRRMRLLLKTVRATLLWPLAMAALLFSRLRSDERVEAASATRHLSAQFMEKTEDARRKLMDSLRGVIELAQASSTLGISEAEGTSRTVRETVEKYVGLTFAVAEINFDDPPGQHETELFRTAGRRGDDLLLAARCVRRRNAARLITHQARARTELLHALAEVREIVTHATASTNHPAARHLSVAVVRFYGHALNLLTLLEDERAATGLVRLLDAECIRLRRLEALGRKETTQEELWTAHATHLA
ncbi:MAG TPA: hypothetical protein VJT09_11840 [Pyrinomonadaceae bacterium]|nr:hypothetical protein [Pyrinomonadaceae bacterium]